MRRIGEAASDVPIHAGHGHLKAGSEEEPIRFAMKQLDPVSTEGGVTSLISRRACG